MISEKGNATMKIILNKDKEIVKLIKEGLKERDGYCPCRREKTEDNKCMCKEFREQIKDPEFEGFCHCMLYYKEK
ncbi:MAG: ferredoxin-thioredoxin reductase catalytic domain-containing protein [Ruminococcus sp.]